MKYQERYTPILVGVNATIPILTSGIGGFLCKTSGNVTVTGFDAATGSVVTVVDAIPVTAGVYYPIPFYLGISGGSFIAAGGASGTLGVA